MTLHNQPRRETTHPGAWVPAAADPAVRSDATVSAQGEVVPLDGRFLYVQVDMAERCNLRCTHCAFVHWRDQYLGNAVIEPALISQLETQVFPFANRVTLSAFHEPLMAPDRLLMALAACVRAGVPRIDMSTNALLVTESIARDLIVGGMHEILFSVDGASPETYARVRVGGTFEDFVYSVRLVQRVRDELGFRDRCSFRFTCIMTRHNIHEAPAFIELGASLGVQVVELRHFVKSSVATIDEADLLHHIPDESDAWFARAAEAARRTGVHAFLPPTFAEMRAAAAPRPPVSMCTLASTSMVISPRGEVLPCCLWHGSDRFEAVGTRSIEEVWNGPQYRKLRAEFRDGAPSRKNCQECVIHFDHTDARYWKTYEFTG